MLLQQWELLFKREVDCYLGNIKDFCTRSHFDTEISSYTFHWRFLNKMQTFKEDKFPIMPFVCSIYVLRKPRPKEGDRHRVIIQNTVPPNPPEPTTLPKTINFINLYQTTVKHWRSILTCTFIFFKAQEPHDCQKQQKTLMHSGSKQTRHRVGNKA